MQKIQKTTVAICGILIGILAIASLLSPFLPLELFIALAFLVGVIPFLLSGVLFLADRINQTHTEILPDEKTIINPNTSAAKTTEEKKIDTVVSAAQTRLHHISAVFPFDLFPDEIIIELKQIVIVRKNFFFSKQEHSIIINDILSPVVESSLLFAKLRIEIGPGGFDQNPPTVSYLRKHEALRARHIIMGLLVCDREEIDLTKLTPVEILNKVEEIGSTHG